MLFGVVDIPAPDLRPRFNLIDKGMDDRDITNSRLCPVAGKCTESLKVCRERSKVS